MFAPFNAFILLPLPIHIMCVVFETLISPTDKSTTLSQMNSVQPQRKNGLENAARIFQANKVNPEGSRSIRDLAGSAEESMNNAEKVSSIMGRKRFEF